MIMSMHSPCCVHKTHAWSGDGQPELLLLQNTDFLLHEPEVIPTTYYAKHDAAGNNFFTNQKTFSRIFVYSVCQISRKARTSQCALPVGTVNADG